MHSFSLRRLVAGAAAVATLSFAFALSAPLQAMPVPAVSVTANAVTGTGSNNQSQTLGWSFRPTTDISVTALGLLDIGADGLVDPHEIGIWQSNGTLLTQTLIPEGTGTTLNENFRYVDIQPLLLAGGQDYVIGALYLAASAPGLGPSDSDPDRDFFQGAFNGANAPRSFAPEITFLETRFGTQQIGNLIFPNQTTPNSSAILGPGFLFEAAENPTATAIPEPASFAIFALGLAVMGFARRRSRECISASDCGRY